MVTVAVGVTLYPTGVEIDHVAVGFAILLCIGSTLSGRAAVGAATVRGCRRAAPIRPRWWRRSDPLTGEITARMRRSLVIAVVPEATHFTLIAAAATVAGGVLILQIALAVYATLVALGARLVATAMLPGLSRAARYGEGLRRQRASVNRLHVDHRRAALLPGGLLRLADRRYPRQRRTSRREHDRGAHRALHRCPGRRAGRSRAV